MLKSLSLLCSLWLLSACQTDNVTNIETEEANIKVTVEKKIDHVIKTEQTKEVSDWQQGQLLFVELEGGFYGIISATGEKLLPLNLSEAYYQAGAKIRFKAEKASVETIQQWGTPITILAIELIAQAESKNSTH